MRHLNASFAVVTLAIFLAGLVLAFGQSAAGRDGRHATHWVVGRTDSQRIAINPVSGERLPLGNVDKSPTQIVSPDGSMVALVLVKDSGLLRAGLHVAHVDNAGVQSGHRLLVPGSGRPQNVQWTPKGDAIVCAHGEDRQSQVFRIDLKPQSSATASDAGKIVETRLSDGGDRAYAPRVSSDGKIAWLVLREQKNKIGYRDLMVVPSPGSNPKTLVARQDITAYDFSPDGSTIVYSTHGEMTFLNATTGEKTGTRDYPKIDERLYAHHAHSIAWSPDGFDIAAAIRFSGGRLRMDDQPFEPMFGDREVFIIPITAEFKPSWFTLDADCMGVEWCAALRP